MNKVKEYIDNLSDAEGDVGGYLERKQRNYETRQAVWSGQSDDGRKWARNLNAQPFPWDGASDHVLRTADGIVNENCALAINAFFRAKVQLQPVESGDAAAKVAAETALRWMLFQHCASDLRREIELLAQFQEQYGLGILHVGWRRTTRTEEKTITLMELQEAFIETMDPQLQVLLEAIGDADQEADAAAGLGALYGPGAKRVQVVRDLRTAGEATFENSYIFENRPEFLALEPMEDVWFPASTADLQKAPWVAFRELIDETELRERELTEGYDAAWIEEVAAKKGEYRRPIRNFYRTERDIAIDTDDDRIELWHYYSRATAKGGAVRVHRCIFHASVPDAAALEELMPYEHQEYPFIEFVRERTSRCLLESRGVPELVESAQDAIKRQWDFRTDRASIAVLPPVRVPANRGKVNLIFGPGAQVPERRPNEFGWMEPPRFDQGTIEIEQSIRRELDVYFGRAGANVPPSLTTLIQQTSVDRWLRSCKAAMAQAFALMQQYVTDTEILRVTGAMPAPFQVSREAIQGRFDLVVEFDVRDLDAEALGKKLDFIAKLAVPLDVAGVIDRANLVKFIVGAVDPSLAQQIVRTSEAATAAEAESEQDALAKIGAGIEPPLPGEGVNAQLRLQVIEQSITKNPNLRNRMGQDEVYKAMVTARVQALQFQMQQSANAQIGRVGAAPALAGGQGGNAETLKY
jgi:hypothetical protein